MRTWVQSKISSSCICVWFESGESRRRRSSRFPYVTPVVETLSEDRVTFRIPSNINDGVPLQNSQRPWHVDCFRNKAPPQTSDRIPKGDLTGGTVKNVGVGRLQVHGICSRRLAYKEVVEFRSKYKKSYFWWCWLLQLNPKARGEHLSSQLSWVAAWLLVTRVCPVYLVEERCYFGVVYLLLGAWWAGKSGRVVSWKVGKVYEGSEVPSWERWEGNEVARWERWESSEVARSEAPGFIRGRVTQGGSKISFFCFWY